MNVWNPAAACRNIQLGRRGFILALLVLMLAKGTFDTAIAALVFNQPWELLHSFSLMAAGGDAFTGPDKLVFHSAMFLLAQPFILMGMLLCWLRLRSLNWPGGLLWLMFINGLNLLLILGLVGLSAKGNEPAGFRWVQSLKARLSDALPQSLGQGILMGSILGIIAAALSTVTPATGWLQPLAYFMVSFIPIVLMGLRKAHSASHCFFVTAMSYIAGVSCLNLLYGGGAGFWMVPALLFNMLMGGYCGFMLQSSFWRAQQAGVYVNSRR